MTAELRDRQHQRFCNALAAVAPDAPTLCEGWTAHDLAVHVWQLKRDPVTWPAEILPPLRGLSRRRAADVKARWSYPDLVERLRAEPAAIACMPDDRFEGYRHSLGEYYVHTQDVARANDLDRQPSEPDVQEALWLRVRRAGLALHWRTRGLVLARPDGRSVKVTPGAPSLTVTGEPSELMCWVYGRTAVADVTLERP